MITERKTVTIFRCHWCDKRYFVASTCKHHEKVCKYNPLNWHPCFACKHLDVFTETDRPDIGDTHPLPSYKFFRCKKSGVLLYTHKAFVNKHPAIFKMGSEIEEMPNYCPYCTDEWFEIGTKKKAEKVDSIFKKRGWYKNEAIGENQ